MKEWVFCAFSYSVSNEESSRGLAIATNVSIVRSFMILSMPDLGCISVCLAHMPKPVLLAVLNSRGTEKRGGAGIWMFFCFLLTYIPLMMIYDCDI